MQTYQELYSNFVESVKLYHQDAVFTDKLFMSLITRAAREFQRMTKFLETEKLVYKANDYDTGNDIVEVIEISDRYNTKLITMSYQQARREVERSGTGFNAESNDVNGWLGWQWRYNNHAENVYNYDSKRSKNNFPNERESTTTWGNHTRIATIMKNRLYVYPTDADSIDDEYFRILYYPDIHPFSEKSTQWSEWFPYDTNFNELFMTTGFDGVLSQYEDLFVEKAVSTFVMNRLDTNQAFIRKGIWIEGVKLALSNKPTLYSPGVSVYNNY